MSSPQVEEFLDNFFKHYTNPNYDPAKAREYYLRTRHLKGRKGGLAAAPASTKGAAQRLPAGGFHRVRPKSAKQRRAEVEAQVKALNARLERLRKILATLREEAKKRSGVDTSTNEAKAAKNKAEKTKLTPKQKREAAARAKKAREKENATPAQQVKEAQEKIAQIQKQIQEAREKLARVIAQQNQRTKTASKGR